MPYADQPTIVLGADGFIGRHLVSTWQARGWPVHAIGRAAGDFTDRAVVDQALSAAPKAGRILHAITKQRTGKIQFDIQAELLTDNARIHLNVLEAWRRHQPQAKLVSLGSSCVYPESDKPLPETMFRAGIPHRSVEGYALAKEVLITGCKTHGDQYGLKWLHCVLATVYGPGAHTEQHRDHFMAGMIARAVAKAATAKLVADELSVGIKAAKATRNSVIAIAGRISVLAKTQNDGAATRAAPLPTTTQSQAAATFFTRGATSQHKKRKPETASPAPSS